MMCLLLLQSRRHQVQNHSHRTLDIDVRRQCLYQLHHRRRSLDTFLFSCVPHAELCKRRVISLRCNDLSDFDVKRPGVNHPPGFAVLDPGGPSQLHLL